MAQQMAPDAPNASPSSSRCSHSGHAHPSPKIAAPASWQTVHQLYRDLGIGFKLRNLPGSEDPKVTNMYLPEVRRSPLSAATIKHLDVVSCWKGLGFAQAFELSYWDRTFKECLGLMVADLLMDIFAGFLQEENLPVEEWTMVPILARFLAVNSPRMIDLAIPDLVSDMIESFYSTGSNRDHTWFIASRDLPSMVFNFLRTRDCFIDNDHCASLEITFSYEQSGRGLQIFGDVQWHPPVIHFCNVPSALPAGAEYRIACRYEDPVLSGSFLAYPGDPEFIVTSNKLPLAWDSNKRCFRAIVPEDKPQPGSDFQQLQREIIDRITGTTNVKELETAFSANILTTFPGDVRFEVTSRYTLVLEVLPKAPRSSSDSGRSPRSPCRPIAQPAWQTERVHHVARPLNIKSEPGSIYQLHLSPEEVEPCPTCSATEAMSNSQYQGSGSSYCCPLKCGKHNVPQKRKANRQTPPSSDRSSDRSSFRRSDTPSPESVRASDSSRSTGKAAPKRQKLVGRVDSCVPSPEESGSGQGQAYNNDDHSTEVDGSGGAYWEHAHGSSARPQRDNRTADAAIACFKKPYRYYGTFRDNTADLVRERAFGETPLPVHNCNVQDNAGNEDGSPTEESGYLSHPAAADIPVWEWDLSQSPVYPHICPVAFRSETTQSDGPKVSLETVQQTIQDNYKLALQRMKTVPTEGGVDAALREDERAMAEVFLGGDSEGDSPPGGSADGYDSARTEGRTMEIPSENENRQ